jgi:hypothetical protein
VVAASKLLRPNRDCRVPNKNHILSVFSLEHEAMTCGSVRPWRHGMADGHRVLMKSSNCGSIKTWVKRVACVQTTVVTLGEKRSFAIDMLAGNSRVFFLSRGAVSFISRWDHLLGCLPRGSVRVSFLFSALLRLHVNESWTGNRARSLTGGYTRKHEVMYCRSRKRMLCKYWAIIHRSPIRRIWPILRAQSFVFVYLRSTNVERWSNKLSSKMLLTCMKPWSINFFL